MQQGYKSFIFSEKILSLVSENVEFELKVTFVGGGPGFSCKSPHKSNIVSIIPNINTLIAMHTIYDKLTQTDTDSLTLHVLLLKLPTLALYSSKVIFIT